MPGELADHAQGQTVRGVGAHETILHINVMALPKCEHPGVEPVEMGLGNRLVHRAPLNGGFCDLISHYEFVFGRAPCKLTRANDECAVGGETPLAPLNRMFEEL